MAAPRTCQRLRAVVVAIRLELTLLAAGTAFSASLLGLGGARAAAQADESSPSVAGEGVRPALFGARRTLISDTQAGAVKAVERARVTATDLGNALTAAGFTDDAAALLAGIDDAGASW